MPRTSFLMACLLSIPQLVGCEQPVTSNKNDGTSLPSAPQNGRSVEPVRAIDVAAACFNGKFGSDHFILEEGLSHSKHSF